MANIDNLKKRYALSGEKYDAAAADAALSDLFAASRKLALLNRDMEARIAALEAERAESAALISALTAERDELADFKAGEARAASEIKREIEKLEEENGSLIGRISTLNEMVDTLEKEKSVLSREHGDAASENERLTAINLVLSSDNEKLTDELSALRGKIDSLEADNSRLSIGINEMTDRNAAPAGEPAAKEVPDVPSDADADVLSIAKAFSEEIGDVPSDGKADAGKTDQSESTASDNPADGVGADDAGDIFGKLAAALAGGNEDTPPSGGVTPEEPAVEAPADGEDPLEAELRRVLDVQNAAAASEDTAPAEPAAAPAQRREVPKADEPEQESIFDEGANPYGFDDSSADGGKARSIGDMKSRLESIRNRKN